MSTEILCPNGMRTKGKTLGKVRLMNANIEIHRVTAPLATEAAWEVESLLLKIFEYGDYSFRSALRGEYSETLDCTFFLAKYQGTLVGAAGCLQGLENKGISLLGLVGVDAEYRGNGVGAKLVRAAINYLKDRDCAAVYLSTPNRNEISGFYEKLGFEKYKGIVMRQLLCSERDFNGYFEPAGTNIRRAVWGDLPAVNVLAIFPADFCTFDFQRHVFSSKYVDPTRFLSIFPGMMKAYAKRGGFANVLATDHNQTIVGIAGISRLPSRARQHVTELDFFVHDNFTHEAERLVRTTVEQSEDLAIDKINCYCLARDHLKRSIIDKIGGRRIAALPDNAYVNGKCEDVLVYQLGDAHGKA